MGDPHGAFSRSAIPLELLGVSDAIHSEDQRIQKGASREWEALAAIFYRNKESPLQSRLERTTNCTAPHEIEREGFLQVDGGILLVVGSHA